MSRSRRKPRRRHRRRRRRRGRSSKYRIPKSLFGMSKLVRFKYAFPGQLGVASDAGPYHTHIFRANSLYDPLRFAGGSAGGGAQPRGFDQISPLYERYAVLGSRCRITFMPHSGSHSGVVFYLQTTLDPSFTSLLTVTDALESRLVSTARYAEGQGARGTTVTRNFSTKKFFNVQSVRDNNQLSAMTDANPAETAFFKFSAAVTHATMTNVEACDYILQISYIALFTNPINPDQS